MTKEQEQAHKEFLSMNTSMVWVKGWKHPVKKHKDSIYRSANVVAKIDTRLNSGQSDTSYQIVYWDRVQNKWFGEHIVIQGPIMEWAHLGENED